MGKSWGNTAMDGRSVGSKGLTDNERNSYQITVLMMPFPQMVGFIINSLHPVYSLPRNAQSTQYIYIYIYIYIL